jgi:hypothetical protein
MPPGLNAFQTKKGCRHVVMLRSPLREKLDLRK